jgi:peptidyl-prolyl cis-trans isomerase SurA
MRRHIAAGLVAAVICSLPGASARGQEIIEQILVKVNGEILTKSDLESRQIAALRDPELGIDPATLQTDAAMQTALREVTPRILADAIDEMLLLQRGRELGYRVTDDQFAKTVEEIKKQNKLESQEQFESALAGEGMTIEQFRRMFERNVIVQQVVRAEVTSKINLTEQEAKEYYARNPAEFTPPPTVTLREIFIAVPAETRDGGVSFSAAADEAAATRAREARDRVLKGEAFEKLVEEISEAGSKANGGLIGPVARNELSPALQKILEGMKQGDVSEPVRTPRGYQIIKLETASAAVPAPYDEVRDLIADKVANEKSLGERRKLIDRLRAQALIEWKNDELKKLYDTHVARQGAANGLF